MKYGNNLNLEIIDNIFWKIIMLNEVNILETPNEYYQNKLRKKTRKKAYVLLWVFFVVVIRKFIRVAQKRFFLHTSVIVIRKQIVLWCRQFLSYKYCLHIHGNNTVTYLYGSYGKILNRMRYQVLNSVALFSHC